MKKKSEGESRKKRPEEEPSGHSQEENPDVIPAEAGIQDALPFWLSASVTVIDSVVMKVK